MFNNNNVKNEHFLVYFEAHLYKTILKKRSSKMRLYLITLILITFCFAGCFSSNPEDIRAFTKPNEVDTTADDYVLQPPDRIQVSCSHAGNRKASRV